MKRKTSPTENSGASREQAAYKMLIREIHRNGLRKGDKLPTQRTLRETSSFSNFSLSRAMEKLVSDGVVERKRRVGTLVADPTAADLSAWTVALLINWDETQLPSPFYSRLLNLLLHGLVKAGCQCRAYIRINHIPGTPDRLTYYASLRKDIDAGLVDGIMNVSDLAEEDLRKLAELEIPVCFSTTWQLASCGSVIDVAKFAGDAIDTLAQMGARRIGVITASYLGYEEFLDRPQKTAAAIPDVVVDPIEVGKTGIGGGRRAARTLIQRADGQRPDAMLTIDDHIALGFAQILRMESDYRPLIAVQTHRTAPLAFALPVLQFELDDRRLAQVAIRMFIERLRNPALADQVVRIAPRLADEDAAYFVQTSHRELRAILQWQNCFVPKASYFVRPRTKVGTLLRMTVMRVRAKPKNKGVRIMIGNRSKSMKNLHVRLITVLSLLVFGLGNIVIHANMLYYIPFDDGTSSDLTNLGTVGSTATRIKRETWISYSSPSANVPADLGPYSEDFAPLSFGDVVGPAVQLPDSTDKFRFQSTVEDNEMTIATWLYWRGPDGSGNPRQGIVSTESSSLNVGWGFNVRSDGSLVFDLAGITNTNNYTTTKITQNNWHHVAVTVDVGSGYGTAYYIDGSPAAENSQWWGGGPANSTANPIQLGVLGTSTHLSGGGFVLPVNGILDDFAMWDER